MHIHKLNQKIQEIFPTVSDGAEVSAGLCMHCPIREGGDAVGLEVGVVSPTATQLNRLKGYCKSLSLDIDVQCYEDNGQYLEVIIS